ncbi:beta-ketoacyl-ACP synthase II [Amphiplicatus metriothermophilus]|uniref:3-oxoacyl-[acyl-carrier-protein] synthase 2 n=1 Tax=Amphiplicatus metriothermophilus TaxID=1519374 RepID=A0A239PYI9_9PROT|nr:beta-ketoacyl-ACP synthase II [Amphiplicatus metriothermophilus]MBB5519856.1 3-oxoacyl-[acyl-carrier-protein] synthase II [Amphiplicatus metriothermophilus]SNT75093.1 3-oxoacyl-[acyl-carrier-protein] synthase II [Amphiplicatus metriothermophilus]
MKRAVITGLGLVTPLASGVEPTWRRILAGESGAGRIEKFDASEMACQIAAEVPRADGYAGGAALVEAGEPEAAFNPDDWVEPREQRRMDDFIVYAVAAAQMAFDDSGVSLKTDEERERAGVMIGSGIGGLPGIEKESLNLAQNGPRRVSPFFITGRLINLASGQVSIRLGLKGPNHAVVTACSSGAHAIGDAARMIMLGDADVMLAGGTEAAISPIGVAGFSACKALTTRFNDRPKLASRPYDRDRDGFLIGEGAGIVVVEEYERAKARGAKIYGEVVGYGLSGDAYHITAPAEDGDGGFRAMRMALERAGLKPDDIDYVNAHGTSTPKGDEIELRAVERLFGKAAEGLVMSSTKSSIGHLLGAAGAVEAIFCLLAMRDNIAPPTINLDNPSVDTPINLAPNKPVEKRIDAVLSNSFGFGGTNACLVMRRADG